MEIIVKKLIEIISEFWLILGEMAPYLLLGFLFAGILYVYVPAKIVERHLGTKGILSTVKAAIFGVPLPLCSCGVIPVAASLRQSKASKGATISFLISTPQTGVDSILVTLSLLGPVFAIFKPVMALINGIVGGLLVNRLTSETDQINPMQMDSIPTCDDGCGSILDSDHAVKKSGKFTTAIRYGFVDLPADLGRALIIGLLLAGLLTAIIPDDYLANIIGTGVLAMLIMIIIAIPVYVCATASIPVAVALMTAGISPGAAFVFLMAGPSTNAATIAVIWKTMGRRTVAIYLLSVAVLAILSGLILDYIFAQTLITPESITDHLFPHWVNPLSAIILIAILLNALIRKPKTMIDDEVFHDHNFTDIQVSGMTCTHCQNVVHRAVIESPGVNEVQVDLKTGMVRIFGDKFDIDSIRKKITGLGYPVK